MSIVFYIAFVVILFGISVLSQETILIFQGNVRFYIDQVVAIPVTDCYINRVDKSFLMYSCFLVHRDKKRKNAVVVNCEAIPISKRFLFSEIW